MESARKIVGSGLGEVLAEAAAAARLDELTILDGADEWAASELFGAIEMAERLGVAQTTLDNWRHAGKILAFRNGSDNCIYPLRQFAQNLPIQGLKRVREQFDADDTAWAWLVEPNRLTGGVEPIEWLREGGIKDVTRAAEGTCDYQ